MTIQPSNSVPDAVDVNQDSDVEFIGATEPRRAQDPRVKELLEFFFPPVHVKNEVSISFLPWWIDLVSCCDTDTPDLVQVWRESSGF